MRKIALGSGLRALGIIFCCSLFPVPASALEPGPFDIIIQANEDYVLNLTHKANGVPINLTGYSFKLQAKKGAIVFLTMSSSVVDAAAGKTRHKLSKAYTADRANTAGIYDLMRTAPDSTVTYRLKGNLKILETVTR